MSLIDVDSEDLRAAAEKFRLAIATRTRPLSTRPRPTPTGGCGACPGLVADPAWNTGEKRPGTSNSGPRDFVRITRPTGEAASDRSGSRGLSRRRSRPRGKDLKRVCLPGVVQTDLLTGLVHDLHHFDSARRRNECGFNSALSQCSVDLKGFVDVAVPDI